MQTAMRALDDTTRNLFEHLLKWHEKEIAWLEQALVVLQLLALARDVARRHAERAAGEALVVLAVEAELAHAASRHVAPSARQLVGAVHV